jgi:hypothetical protein
VAMVNAWTVEEAKPDAWAVASAKWRLKKG